MMSRWMSITDVSISANTAVAECGKRITSVGRSTEWRTNGLLLVVVTFGVTTQIPGMKRSSSFFHRFTIWPGTKTIVTLCPSVCFISSAAMIVLPAPTGWATRPAGDCKEQLHLRSRGTWSS